MRIILLLMLLFFFGTNSFGQKQMIGVGGELSVLGLKPNVRMWVSKTKGFEVFGGVSSEVNGIKFNDYEGGFKYLHTFLYNRTNRTYFGLMGKWKRVEVDKDMAPGICNLPIPGLLIGKEWFNKRAHLKGFAIELGYQYGVKKYKIRNLVTNDIIGEKQYEEFPLIFNLRYSYYKKKR